MNRIVAYLAFAIAASDLVCFSLLLALPALDLESSVTQKLEFLVFPGGLILSVFSVLLVYMLLNPIDESEGLTKLFRNSQKLSAVVLVVFAIFVFLFVVNVFRQGL
jgi:uncharacterized membrane protein